MNQVPPWIPSGGGYPPEGTNSLALVSLFLAIGGVFTMGLTCLPAIICGHLSRRQIKATSERGAELALAGTVIGYIGVVVASIFWGFALLLFYNM
jgi:hypothetical protein